MVAILQVLGDPKQYRELNYVLEGKRYKEKFLSSDQIRNFIAHSGFLREITRVRKEGEKIYVRYDKEN